MMPNKAKLYIAWVAALGLVAIAIALSSWNSTGGARFATFLVLSAFASALKVRLPGITGTFSIGFVFVLVGIAGFSFAETVVIGCLCALVQCTWKPKYGVTPVQVLFNICSIAISIAVSYSCAHLLLRQWVDGNTPALMALTVCVFFAANTLIVSGVLALLEKMRFAEVWRRWFLWSFPYYLAGSVVAVLISILMRHQWQSSLLLLPLMYLIYYYYRLFMERNAKA